MRPYIHGLPAGAAIAALALLSVAPALSAQNYAQVRTIEIEILGADVGKDGPGRPWDTVGSSLPDCYAVVEVDGEIVLVTEVDFNTMSPRWSAVGTFETDDFDDRLVIRVFDDDANDEAPGAVSSESTLAARQPMVREIDADVVRARMARDDLIAEGVFPLTDDEAHARTSIIIQFEDRDGRRRGRIDAIIRPLPSMATASRGD